MGRAGRHLCTRGTPPADPTSQPRCAGSRGTAKERQQDCSLAQAQLLDLRSSASQPAALSTVEGPAGSNTGYERCSSSSIVKGTRLAHRHGNTDLIVRRSPRKASCAVRCVGTIERWRWWQRWGPGSWMTPSLLLAERNRPTPEDMRAPQDDCNDHHSCQGIAAKHVVTTLQPIRPRTLNEHARPCRSAADLAAQCDLDKAVESCRMHL